MPTENYSPNWHVRCVSAPGPDTDLTLHVSFDNTRFIFGCGEGTQRAYVQKRLSLKGVEAIFLSSSQNKTRMGVPGIIMTLADAGIPEVTIAGPPDTAHFISTFRSSVMREQFNVIPRSTSISNTPHDVTEMYRTINITVKAVSLVPPPLRTTPIISDKAAPTIDLDHFRPDFSTTRPSLLPRPEIEAWRNLVVNHMFDRSRRVISTGNPKGPFVRPGPEGAFMPSWPDIKYPLPIPLPEEQATELVYILEAPPVRGKFDVKRAVALGVPNGPIRGKLVKGEDIEVDDPSVEGGKRIVRPADCLAGGTPGAVLIIVTCSIENLPSLLESTAFDTYKVTSAERRKVHLMVHRVPHTVFRLAAYQAWMASFGEDVQHLIADPEVYSNEVFFRSSGWNLAELSMIDAQVFHHQHDKPSGSFEVTPLPLNARDIVSNLQIKMHPPGRPELLPHHERDIPLPITANRGPSLGEQAYQTASPELRTALKNAHNATRQSPPPASFPGSDIVVTTLGTGSAIPSKYRNVSSTLLTIPKMFGDAQGAILLDCGEGTLGQLRRRYGPKGMGTLYDELKMIFISHMHADHHLGLHSILEDRFKHGVKTPLYIIAPPSIALGMQESASWQSAASDEAISNIIFLEILRFSRQRQYLQSSGEPALSPTRRSPPPLEDKYEAWSAAPYEWGQEDLFNGTRRWPMDDVMGNSEAIYRNHCKLSGRMLGEMDLHWIHCPQVFHRGMANGLVLRHRSGWQIVYSGDTKPCGDLIKAGKGATLLIHEATLEDDKPEMAARKGHSTFSQAISVGRQMGARHILLNHFSQRYPKCPKLPTISPPSPNSQGKSTSTEPVISISFDLMSIKISEMWKMAHYMEPIALMFPEEEEEGDSLEMAVEKDTNTLPVLEKGKKSRSSAGKSGRSNGAGDKGLTDGNLGEGHGRKKRRMSSPRLQFGMTENTPRASDNNDNDDSVRQTHSEDRSGTREIDHKRRDGRRKYETNADGARDGTQFEDLFKIVSGEGSIAQEPEHGYEDARDEEMGNDVYPVMADKAEVQGKDDIEVDSATEVTREMPMLDITAEERVEDESKESKEEKT